MSGPPASPRSHACRGRGEPSPTNQALALINFASLAAYEQYRERLAKDNDNVDSVRRADESGCILIEDRAVLERV